MKKLFVVAFILLVLTSWSSAQNALDFGGANDFVQTDYRGVTGSINRTFEAWIYVPSSAPSSNLAILDYGLNAVGSRNTFSVSGTKQLTFLSGGTNANISTTVNAVPVDQWTHVAFVLNNGTGYLYVDSVQMGTGSLTTVNTPITGQSVIIGQRVSGGSIPFPGIIDEVRIWDVARTPAEIHASMNMEICSPHPNLKLYMQLNEGIAGGNNATVTNITDNSGNDYTGVLNNFTLTGATSNWVIGAGIGDGTSTTSLQESACDSFALMPGSPVYTTTGVYTEMFTNVAGCDSIVTLDLTINNSNSATDTQTACDSYTWIDGNTYTSNNDTATFILNNTAGCDSTVTLDLTINNSTAGVDSLSACDSFTWIDGNTYTSNNDTATFVLTNTAGCDSTVTLDLTIETVDASATQDGDSLTANEVGATYQWVECPGMTAINGATSQSYTATANGDYAVIVTSNLCSDTSACFTVSTVGIIENQFGNALHLFPNPTNGKISIDMGESYNSTVVRITDLNGKLVSSNTYTNSQLLNLILNEPTGVYLMFIETNNKKALIRLIKQ